MCYNADFDSVWFRCVARSQRICGSLQHFCETIKDSCNSEMHDLFRFSTLYTEASGFD